MLAKILIAIGLIALGLWIANMMLEVAEVKICARSTVEQRQALHCEEVLK